MAKGINHVTLLGNLGSDPELRMTSNGTAVLTCNVATSKGVKNQDGSWGERTEWHRVVVWGKSAEALGKFLSKGHRVAVQGELRTSSYEGSDGVKRYSTQIIARELVLLTPPENRKKAEHYQKIADEDLTPADDDDIPF